LGYSSRSNAQALKLFVTAQLLQPIMACKKNYKALSVFHNQRLCDTVHFPARLELGLPSWSTTSALAPKPVQG
jgi:hypothetical protein